MAWFKKDDPRGDLDRTIAVPSQQPLPPPPRDLTPQGPLGQPAAPVAARPEPSPNVPQAEPARPAPAAPAGLAGLAVAPRQASEPAPAPRVAEQASVFAESVEIEGSLDGDGDVVLRGRVRGSISITGVLVVGETGRVQADVAAREVVNAGVVEGNIQARDRVRVQATGLVQGDIDSPSIVIDDGGGVEGFVAMQPSGGDEEEDDLPARPPAPAAGLLRKPASVQPGITPSPAAAPTPHPVPVRAQPPPPIAAAPVAPAPVAAPPVAAPPSHPVLGAAPQPPPAPAAARPPAAGLLFRPAQSPAALPSQPPPMSPDATVLVAPRPPSATPASGNGGNGGAGARDPFADEVATGAAGAREDGPLGGDPASNPL